MTILSNILLILIGVLLFEFVIFFHELGHFMTAKASGIKVNEFALGMGPKIFGFKRGETDYTLRLFPIGGYCAMEGEDEASDDGNAFGTKPVWKRMIVIVAGGIMNIILGFILMIIVLVPQERFATTQIAGFAEDSKIEQAGMTVDDEIVEIDNYAIYTDRDLSFALAFANPDSIDFVVKRDGQLVRFDDVKMNSQKTAERRNVVSLDFFVKGENRTVSNVINRAFKDTFSMSRMVIESLKGMVTGRFSINEMAGPIGTAQIISQAAGEGLKQSFGVAVSNILMIIIMISVNLGIVNLLPLPALDGGRFVFLLLEAIFRKPVPQKYEAYVHTAGFVLLIGFMIFISFHDILRIFNG